MVSEMEENKKRLIETLITGRDAAKRLQNSVRRKVNDDGSVSLDDLATEILGSFSAGLSLLGFRDSGDLSGVPASPHEGASLLDQVPETYTANTGKKPAPALKERRGCYKRRRTTDSRIKVRCTIEDGYAWRKYGQKQILNSKFPRCYYRCTHKNAHQCKALKQVQMLEDGSDMFHITYIGYHTCPTLRTLSDSGVVLNFEDSQNHHYLSSSPSTTTDVHVDPSVKEEDSSKAQSDDVSDNVSSANDVHSSPSLVWKEILNNDMDPTSFMGFDQFDHEDSSASSTSHGYLFMDFLKNDGFLGDFQLDDDMFR